MALTKIGTDGVKDDAVTTDKLANAINTERTANTAKVSTTINNNADNRVITGSGTANTLNGEANLTYDGNSFISTQTTSSSDSKVIIRNSNTPASGVLRLEFHHGTGSTEGTDRFRYGFIEGFRQSGSNDGGLIFGTKPNNAGAPAERMRIDSSGKVGIGLTAPESPLHIQPTHATGYVNAMSLSTNNYSIGGGPKITWKSNHPSYTNWKYAELAGVYNGGNFGGAFVFNCNPGSSATAMSERLRIQHGGGISFNGDTAVANALDDYEEGTWTINTDVGSPNTTHSASYTKIGRSVTVNVYITCPTSSSGSNFRITSLPFQALGGANYFIGATYTQVHTTDNVFVQINAGNNDVYVYKRIGDSVTYADLSGAYLLFTCTYFTG